MNILLSTVLGFCVVTALVAVPQDDFNILEDLLLRKLERAVADTEKAAAPAEEQSDATAAATKDSAATAAANEEAAIEKEAAVTLTKEQELANEKEANKDMSCPKDDKKENEEDEEKGKETNKHVEAIPEFCCGERNEPLLIDLTTTPTKKLHAPGMSGYVIKGTKGEECSARAWVKVTFESSGCEEGCVKTPLCGKKMLKVVLTLHEAAHERSGHMLNIGDSQSNNGWGGDFNNQYCDAELHGIGNSIVAYQSDKCKSHPAGIFYNVLSRAKQYLTLYISNNHVLIKEENGQEHTICSHCLFCLAGQADGSNPNLDIFVGLNRVIHGMYRAGKGICKASLSWECPCQWP